MIIDEEHQVLYQEKVDYSQVETKLFEELLLFANDEIDYINLLT